MNTARRVSRSPGILFILLGLGLIRQAFGGETGEEERVVIGTLSGLNVATLTGYGLESHEASFRRNLAEIEARRVDSLRSSQAKILGVDTRVLVFDKSFHFRLDPGVPIFGDQLRSTLQNASASPRILEDMIERLHKQAGGGTQPVKIEVSRIVTEPAGSAAKPGAVFARMESVTLEGRVPELSQRLRQLSETGRISSIYRIPVGEEEKRILAERTASARFQSLASQEQAALKRGAKQLERARRATYLARKVARPASWVASIATFGYAGLHLVTDAREKHLPESPGQLGRELISGSEARSLEKSAAAK